MQFVDNSNNDSKNINQNDNAQETYDNFINSFLDNVDNEELNLAYEKLEISVDASDEEVKKSYRFLAMKYHPDKNINKGQTDEKFKEINNAYETIKKARNI
jgi:DnaJ-class molecular chaperone